MMDFTETLGQQESYYNDNMRYHIILDPFERNRIKEK